MRVLLINSVCGIRSTGRICTDIATKLDAQGHEVKIAYGREEVPDRFKKYAVRIGTNFDIKTHGVCSRVFDNTGFSSKGATEKFIKWVKEYDPDVIHLHNLHGYYINIEILFDYLKYCGKRIIWTLHDCWPVTGHCAYFDFADCDRWKTGCTKCNHKKEYPSSYVFSRSATNYEKKVQLFTGIPNLTIVTPSYWLMDIVKQSLLKEYSVKVINNGIDTNVFKPQKNKYPLFENINKKIILGVASPWHKRKGLDVFLQLSKILNQNLYQIALVGLSKQQCDSMPSNIIAIKQTNSPSELAEIYSSAYVFVNPTYEDNYPTTNLEAIACGTPVITFETGGSPESARMYGVSIPKDHIKDLVEAIETAEFIRLGVVDVDYKKTIDKYVDLYEEN